jgi:vacuolar protein sorting-associated protein 29
VVVPGEADALLAEARRLDVDVLCWGGTGRFDAYEYGERFFVNPGSGTGVGGGEASFCLMDVSVPFLLSTIPLCHFVLG